MEMSEAFVSNWISLRHNPKLERFQVVAGPPATHRLFDWVIWEPDDPGATRVDLARPRSILCLAKRPSIQRLLARLDDESTPSLVVGGTDTLLSDLLALLEPNLHRFRKVFYEAKNIEHDKIFCFPMGFISFYLRNAGYENVKTAVELSDITEKSHLILAAWGKQWEHLDNIIDDRISAVSFLANHPIFQRKMIDRDKYWLELAKYQFLLAPKGKGIQAPKLAEAWMVKTVPIVIRNPCFADLRAMGFPLVLVNNWKEVTPEALSGWLEFRGSINWQRVRYQLTNDYLKTLVTD